MPAEWGGDTEFVEVSLSRKKASTVCSKLVSWSPISANLKPIRRARSRHVLASRVDKGRGPVATILIQNGTLKAGDFFICGAVFGKVRALFEHSRPLHQGSWPIHSSGSSRLQGVPEAGDHSRSPTRPRLATSVGLPPGQTARCATPLPVPAERITLDQLHEQLKTGEVKELGVVIKGDVQGSVEVLREMLPKLSTTRSSSRLSAPAWARSGGKRCAACFRIWRNHHRFGVRPERKASPTLHNKKAWKFAPTRSFTKFPMTLKSHGRPARTRLPGKLLGRAEVRNTSAVTGAGTIAGCYVTRGVLNRTGKSALFATA